ncbi:MAG: phosphomethylpyrimidine synthase ThiC [Spirochaetales bacterium]|nr:phosphomethylpyrimidine synthase ThiC [Spirochaetales bacterium]
MKYTTQMEQAKLGRVTLAMKSVLENERISSKDLLDKMSEGKIVIPYNKLRDHKRAHGVGQGLRTKINANLGVSKTHYKIDEEWKKVEMAEEYQVASIMDLSCYGNTSDFRRKLVKSSSAIIGTVPVYDLGNDQSRDFKKMTKDDFFKIVICHAQDGVDFMTIHAGLTLKTIEAFENNPRCLSIVSRGGALLYSWMKANGAENPFYEDFPRLLDIARDYDFTLSLGDACRPGCLEDATDAAQIQELLVLGDLTQQAWEANVQVMIEGPGHMPMDQIAPNVLLAKKLCHQAPLYVLGPLVTDIAPGYDHITSAIGGAIAAQAGADFLCFVTPAEHLRLPDLSDFKEGIMASLIAAHAADISKGIPGVLDQDKHLSRERAVLNWEGMFRYSLDPVKPRLYREGSEAKIEKTCTMCGPLCSIKNMTESIFQNH